MRVIIGQMPRDLNPENLAKLEPKIEKLKNKFGHQIKNFHARLFNIYYFINKLEL